MLPFYSIFLYVILSLILYSNKLACPHLVLFSSRFLTYNYVDGLLPTVLASDDLLLSLARSALLGICASSVSDITSNSLRVIKTTKQTARLGDVNVNGVEGNDSTSTKDDKTYQEIVQMIIEKDGLRGLFGRGLQTRLLNNCIQGAIFSVLFKYFQQQN
jgi:hypothetical protein